MGVSLVNLGSKQKKNERDKEIKQCMCKISPSCDVFSFLFIYLSLGGAGNTVKACVM